MEILKMTWFLAVLMIGLVASQTTEEPTTTEPVPTTTQALPSTELDGGKYGDPCNGLLAPCHRYDNTVSCLQRRPNETTGEEMCETGIGVDLGRCQCTRNCPLEDQIYHENGEFDEERQLCVGFVGQLCSAFVPYCTKNASCNFLSSQCQCNSGYVPDPEGKRCVSA